MYVLRMRLCTDMVYIYVDCLSEGALLYCKWKILYSYRNSSDLKTVDLQVLYATV